MPIDAPDHLADHIAGPSADRSADRSTGGALLAHRLIDLACRDLDRTALIGPDGALSFGALGDLIVARREAFDLPERSLVVLTGANSIDWVVSYLALLAGGHVPLLAGSDAAAVDRVVDHWSPTAVVRTDADGWRLRRHRERSHALHPDLALLMSTSGSTGSPKLVRLSDENLVENARSIAEFQSIGPTDRAITSLPLHYSFGLSVLHSHLAVGASVVVTDGSIVDPCFADAVAEHGVTNVAGVPHTWELAERVGPERLRTPSMRFLAHAGGRMAPDDIRRWSTRAASWGVDWFSMYGQTEATARIAYLPPDRVADAPATIGRPIPGGSWRLDPVEGLEPGAGEIVYRGPNVMLGYAVDGADLARGRAIDELRTGDIGRIDADTGFVTITGRLARRVKPFGLRVDLDDVEARLGRAGVDAVVVGDDERVVAAAPAHDPATVVERLAEITGLPTSRCHAIAEPAPRLANGKIDAPALLSAFTAERPAGDAGDTGDTDDLDDVRAIFATVLGVPPPPATATFVSLGGDSLSYVECSVRLEAALGALPTDWHLRPIAELTAREPAAGGRRSRIARVDTTVVLRAVGILAVVSTHMRLWHVPGGAHLLLGVVGYNVARFLLPIESPAERIRAGFRTLGRVAVPTVVWTAAFMIVGQYTWTTLSLANNYLGPRSHAGNHWHFWFIEVFVHLVLLVTLVMAVPGVWRLDRRFPYALPLVVLAGAIALRLPWADMGDWYNLRFRTHAVAWFFVLGWLVQRSNTVPQRMATTIICIASAPGVFMNPQREFFIAGGLVLLVWWRRVPVPRVVVRPVATIAAASMWILISHFMIWPPMKELFIVEVAYPLTVLASLGVWWLAERVTPIIVAVARRWWSSRPPVRHEPTPVLTP